MEELLSRTDELKGKLRDNIEAAGERLAPVIQVIGGNPAEIGAIAHLSKRLTEMFAIWLRSTSSLIAARMPMLPPAITNWTPRVQEFVG